MPRKYRHHNNEGTRRISHDGHLRGLEDLAMKLTHVPLMKGKPRKEREVKEACSTTTICHACGITMPVTDPKIGICEGCKREAEENRGHQAPTLTNEEIFGE